MFCGPFFVIIVENFASFSLLRYYFNPQLDGQIEVVNQTLIHSLSIYYHNSPSKWDLSLTHRACIQLGSSLIYRSLNFLGMSWFPTFGSIWVALIFSLSNYYMHT